MPDDLGDEKIPCIVIPPIYHPQSNYAPHINDPLLALIAALREPAHSPTIVDLIGSLVQEGKFFAKSSSGLNWAAILSRSSMVENAWLMWNQMDLDLPLYSLHETNKRLPSEFLQGVLNALAAGNLAHYVSVLNEILAGDTLRSTRVTNNESS
jgi:hypothetical protein